MIHHFKRTTRPGNLHWSGAPDHHFVRFDWEQSGEGPAPSAKALFIVHLAESAHRNIRDTAPAEDSE